MTHRETTGQGFMRVSEGMWHIVKRRGAKMKIAGGDFHKAGNPICYCGGGVACAAISGKYRAGYPSIWRAAPADGSSRFADNQVVDVTAPRCRR